MPSTSLTHTKRKLQGIWYSQLIDDLNQTITEGVFTSRDILIETYHSVGKMLREASEKHNTNISVLVYDSAEKMEVSDRTLWYAVKFFDKYPDRSVLKEGKNISWQKIKSKYLTESTEKEPTEKRCPNCNFKL